MNTNQSNKMAMYQRVSAWVKLNLPVLILIIPALVKVAGLIEQAIKNVLIQESARGNNVTGKLEVRDETENELVELLVPVCGALIAYASETKNTILFEKAKIKKSALYRLRDNELVLKAKSIAALVQENLVHLADYAVTAETLAALQTAIANFENAVSAVDTSSTARVGARIAVYDGFDAVDNILKNQLDQLMETVKKTNVQLYNEYIAARVIHDLGGGRGGKEDGTTPPPSATPPAK